MHFTAKSILRKNFKINDICVTTIEMDACNANVARNNKTSNAPSAVHQNSLIIISII